MASHGEFDVAVIGGGPGGYVAAIRAAQLGARVALIEKARIGGVCLNVGCIATKALAATAELLAAVKAGGTLGVEGPARLDLAGALSHKDAVVAEMVGGVERLLAARGVQVLRGRGRLLDGRTVAIEMEERLKGIWQTTEEDEELQQRFWLLFKESKLHGVIKARIGTDFLQQNQDLLK